MIGPSEIRFEYLQEGENSTVIQKYGNTEEIVTKNNKGDIIYENYQGLEWISDITYNEDGSKVMTNNFLSKYVYDKDGRLLELSNDYGDKRLYGYKIWEPECKLEETIETLNGELNEKITEMNIGEDKIKITTDYHIGYDREPNETYLFNVGSNLRNERKEFEQYHDDLIHRRLYDENHNMVEDRTYNCVSTRKIDYDENNNVVSEKTYNSNNNLVYEEIYKNEYDEQNRLIKQNIYNNDIG